MSALRLLSSLSKGKELQKLDRTRKQLTIHNDNTTLNVTTIDCNQQEMKVTKDY